MNNETGIPKMFRLDKQLKMITITNCIFSGPNGGSKVNSGNSDYSGWLSYAGCYVTSDMVQLIVENLMMPLVWNTQAMICLSILPMVISVLNQN